VRNKWIWIGVAVVVTIVAIWVIRSQLARDAAELIAARGEVRLRDELRPIRGSTRVLVIALDGVGDEALRTALAAGRMPRLSRFLGPQLDTTTFAHAYAAPDALSILPSTTWAAWTSVFTGQPAAQTGVSGNEWFERETMTFYAPGPVSVEGFEHTVQLFTDDLLGQRIRVPTLFERAELRAHVSVQGVHRGADLVTIPDPAQLGMLFGTLVRGIGDEGSVERAAYEELDRRSVDQLIESAREHGIPDLQIAYFAGVDLYTHLAEHALEDKQRYIMEILDPQIGRILDFYADHGVLDQTYVVIVSDHGHTPVLNDLRNALGHPVETIDAAGGADVMLLQQLGFRVRPWQIELGEEQQDFQAVVAYQGAMSYIYLADRSTCPRPGDRCDWSRPPRYVEDVLPVAHAFFEANHSGAGVPRLRQSLELVFAREPVVPGQPTRPFEVFDGAALVPVADYLTRDPKPELLDLDRRMRGLAEGPYGHHAGDIVLLAYSGRHRPITDRYYFSAKYHSWHGSPAAHDSRIPLVVARQGAAGAALRERVERLIGTTPDQLSVTPLILGLLRDDEASR
jgi:hypothetical protein